MATIVKKSRKGGTSYKAIIRKRGRVLKTKTFTRKKDATDWARTVEADRERMEALESEGARLTFSELAERYLAQWSGKDDNFPTRLARFTERLGKKFLIDITRADLKKIVAEYERGGRKPATVNRLSAAVSAVLGWAVKEDLIPDNPAKGIPHRTENNKRIRYLSDDERGRLLAACRESEWSKLHLLVLVALTTGARQGELLRARWSDINWRDGTLFLADTKNGEPRMLTPPPGTLDALRKFRQIGSGLIFASERKPKKPFTFRKHWVKALEAAGVEDFRFHDLRHSAASYLVMSGATLHETAEILGHRSTETTKRYAHLSTDHKKQLTARVLGDLDG